MYTRKAPNLSSSSTTNTSTNISLQLSRNMEPYISESKKKTRNSNTQYICAQQSSSSSSSSCNVISSSKCIVSNTSSLVIPSNKPKLINNKRVSISSSGNFKRYNTTNLYYVIFLFLLMMPVIMSFILILSSMYTDEFVRRGSSTINSSSGISTKEYKSNSQNHPLLRNKHSNNNNLKDKNEPFRILHILTSIDEFENGERKTTEGSDRLTNIVIPTLKSTIDSFTSQEQQEKQSLNWIVDVYVILGYKCNDRCHKALEEVVAPANSSGIGLEIWDDAIPYNHGFWPEDKNQIIPMPYALARQHRFVIKDKLNQYDFFSSWEDDMKITADHIKTYLNLSNEIERLKEQEELKLSSTSTNNNDTATFNINNYTAPLNLKQLERMIPGFIRVEVLENGYMSQEVVDPIPLHDESVTIDPNPCCSWNHNVSTAKATSENNRTTDIKIPVSNIHPTKNDIVLWETSILALRVRQMSNSFLNWIGLLQGVKIEDNNNRIEEANIQSYWSGTKGYFGNEPEPQMSHPFYMAQQAGWMMSRKQIIYADNNCKKGFLPNKEWEESGLKAGYHSVEFWSGGYQLFFRECNLQRFVSLDPDTFSRQLIFHVSNNKQKQRPRQRFILADHLLKQLHTVSKDAENDAGINGVQ